MNKYASFALAFLLVFSGCLGGSDDNLEEETVEPVGETDFTSLEKDNLVRFKSSNKWVDIVARKDVDTEIVIQEKF